MKFSINQRVVDAGGFSSHCTLLDYLRAQGLTGAKEGCAEGECGACAVALVRPNGAGSELRVVNSCLMLLPMVAGQEVYTVEGLAYEGRLSEPQRAIAELGGSQCGYCTPGFAMSLFAEYHRPGRAGACDPHAMSGNLCRCTGYRPLRDAALSLGMPVSDDEIQKRLRLPAPAMEAFSRPGFARPGDVAECLAMLQRWPEATLVAGGTDLSVEANLRGRRFTQVISVEAIPELRVFRESAQEVVLGAGLTLSEIEALWTCAPPIAREWFPLFASPLIRNRATLGGNLATASPVGDGAPMLLSLDARVNLAGVGGWRQVALADFFLDYRKTLLQAGEVLVSVSIPKPFPQLSAFHKVAKRALDDISTVAAGFAISLDSSGRIEHCRIAFGGMAATPLRVPAAEAALRGRPWDATAVNAAQRAMRANLRPMDDHRGSAAYRLAMAQSLLQKFHWQTRLTEAA
ncbi:MAG: FAD binding domain-containing protein [Candidatus Solibacter sp.]